jgi:hypothetical protein
MKLRNLLFIGFLAMPLASHAECRLNSTEARFV